MEKNSDEEQKKTWLDFTVCPCCGAPNADDGKFVGCRACGALPVGEPLAPPDNLLPSYWRAFGAFASGAVLLVVFFALTLSAWLASNPLPSGGWNLIALALSFVGGAELPFKLSFWDFVVASEVAAWRLKLLVLPAALFAFWMSRQALRGIENEPARFTGRRLARFGMTSAVSSLFAVVFLIGITIPARLERRELARRAEREAAGYAVMNLLIKYKARYGTFPTDLNDLNDEKLKEIDADGMQLAVLSKLKNINYTPTSDIAAVTLPNARLRGASARVRPVALKANGEFSANRLDDAPLTGLPFTSFKLILPGKEGFFGKEEDIEITESGIVAPPSSGAKMPSAETPRRPR